MLADTLDGVEEGPTLPLVDDLRVLGAFSFSSTSSASGRFRFTMFSSSADGRAERDDLRGGIVRKDLELDVLG